MHQVLECGEDGEAVALGPGTETRALARDGQVACDGKRRKDAAVVRYPGQATTCDLVRRCARDVSAVEADGTAPRARQAEDGTQRRRLSRAVLTQQRDDLAGDSACADRAADVLARVGLAGKERIAARRLSYGERRALEIGVALAARPRLLFLDEPTAGLGADGTARLADLIAELKRQVTVVVIEHDMRFLFGLADRIFVIQWGQVIAEGAAAQLAENPWVRRSALGALA